MISDAGHSQFEISTLESSDASVVPNRQNKKLLQSINSSALKRLKANEKKQQ